MKRTLLLPALFVLFTATSGGNCRKSNSPINQLPPETHDGAMTMGCYVNNSLFIPQEPGYDPNSFSTASIYLSPSFDLSFDWIDNNNSNNNPAETIFIHLDSIQIMQGATYTLGAPPDSLNQISHAQWATVLGGQLYNTAGTGTGQLTVDYYYQYAFMAIVSGHFSFDAIDLFGDTLHVTEGRFDMAMQYP